MEGERLDSALQSKERIPWREEIAAGEADIDLGSVHYLEVYAICTLWMSVLTSVGCVCVIRRKVFGPRGEILSCGGR